MQLSTALLLALGAANAYANVIQRTPAGVEKRQPEQEWDFTPEQGRCINCIAACEASYTDRVRKDEVHAPMWIGKCFEDCERKGTCYGLTVDEYLEMFGWNWAPPAARDAARAAAWG
ncbi:hypothetical protein F5B20DRAFT_583295 [Whalleya microplaca]|nr:hypothetical protein F5B20DRAFT_583295 [Whalleya microplaca]